MEHDWLALNIYNQNWNFYRLSVEKFLEIDLKVSPHKVTSGFYFNTEKIYALVFFFNQVLSVCTVLKIWITCTGELRFLS